MPDSRDSFISVWSQRFALLTQPSLSILFVEEAGGEKSSRIDVTPGAVSEAVVLILTVVEKFLRRIVRCSSTWLAPAADETWTPVLRVTPWLPYTSGTSTKTWPRPCCTRNSARPGLSCLSGSVGTWLLGVLLDMPMSTSNSQRTVSVFIKELTVWML